MGARRAPLRILLIDDSEDDRLLVARLMAGLHDAAAVFRCASTFQEGLDALCAGDHDVCLLDYDLGLHSGLELLHEAHARGCAVPTIIMTGYAERHIDLAATAAGAADFVDKSRLDGATLERALRYAISQARAREALRRSEAGFRALLEALPVAIVVHDQGHIRYANAAAVAQTRTTAAADVIGKRYSDLVVPEPDPGAATLPPEQPRLRRMRRLDGSEYVVELSSLSLTFDGAPAQVVIAHDITERLRHQEETDSLVRQLAESNAKLLALSNTDELTSLWNYRRLQELLLLEIRRARRSHQAVSVLMIDIDHFKPFNDRNGHEAGNAVLRSAAGILRAGLREIDILARYGGEEMCAVLPETALSEAAVVAERLRERIAAERFAGADQQPGGRLSISIGVAELVSTDETPADLIQRADEALYRAKRGGRDRVEVAR